MKVGKRSAAAVVVLAAAAVCTGGFSAARDSAGHRRHAVPISRGRKLLQALDDRLAQLLAGSTGGLSAKQVDLSARITYRMLLRALLKAAARARDASLKGQIMLKADILRRGMHNFDLIVKALKDPTPVNMPLFAALAAFNKAGQHFKRIHNAGNLQRLLHHTLVPLQPLYLHELTKSPVVWPQWPARARAQAAAPTQRGPALPPVSATILRLQSANISQAMRTALQRVLKTIRREMAKPKQQAAAQGYYRRVLQVLALDSRLNHSGLLPAASAARLNRQLLLGLLLFKDPRTRASAARRLNAVAQVAQVVQTVQAAGLPPTQHQVMAAALHDAIMKLQHTASRAKGAAELQAILAWVAAVQDFSTAAALPAPAMFARNWRLAKTAGTKVKQKLPKAVESDGLRGALASGSSSLENIARNMGLLARMPTDMKAALLYHPRPADGVQRTMRRWAAAIAKDPANAAAVASGLHGFEQTLALLGAARRAARQHLSSGEISSLTGGKYPRFLRQFNRQRKALADGLAKQRGTTAAAAGAVTRDQRVLAATAAMQLLKQNAKAITKLNGWAIWQADPPVRRLILRALRRALVRRYRMAGPGGVGRHQPRRVTTGRASAVPRIPFPVAQAAMCKLATLCDSISGRVSGDPTLWTTAYTRLMQPPPQRAMFANAAAANALACLRLNQAAFNYQHGSRRIARGMLQQAASALAAIPVPPYR